MIRHLFVAALRNMAASPLQSAIAIGSLTIGLWAAILAGLVAENQLSYDHFVPGSAQIYMAAMRNGDGYITGTPYETAAYLRGFPGVQAVARINGASATFTHAGVNLRQQFSWVDPNFFKVMPLPALYGDPATALQHPDGMVLTRAMAQKYFGRDDARGQTLLLDHKNLMTVRAVIGDIPAHATNLRDEIFTSDLASFSPLAQADRGPSKLAGDWMFTVVTLARVDRDASVPDLNTRTSVLLTRLSKKAQTVTFLRLDAVQLSPLRNPANRQRLAIFIAIAALILLLACLNFVTLSVARSAGRAVDVGIRKVAGAGQSKLVMQFLGESILQALLALGVAMALVEWTLPMVNIFLQSGALFRWWRDPGLLAALGAGAVLVGVAAGLYPAFILSAFRPALVLKGLMLRSSMLGQWARQGLVALQFAIPLVLVIAAIVVLQQNRFAATDALHLDTSQMLMIDIPECGTAFDTEVAALPGVAAMACSGPSLLPAITMENSIKMRDGKTVTLKIGDVGFGFFQLYHLAPLAGRLPDPAHPGDAAQGFAPPPLPGVGNDAAQKPPAPATVRLLINQAALASLGFATAQAAIGKPLNLDDSTRGLIIGVVPNFSLYPPIEATGPTIYRTVANAGHGWGIGGGAAELHVRLRGNDPDTLVAIDAAWAKHSQDPISRIFLTDYVQQQEVTVLHQAQAFSVFAGVAAALACVGLFGLSFALAGRRIKEIGVRKAMGAGNGEILRLLLWQFGRPVLLANLIAWPVAFWLMNRWLAEFPYHVELHWWVFALSSVLLLFIATLTVAGHALSAARQKPVLALRYE